MARRPRQDTPGSWHHVTNRGLAKRPMFEHRDDVRFFLSRVARAVRRGQIRIHAFNVMTTHFHMLASSPRAELSKAMREIQNVYVRRFNRRAKRDGSLVRGRFWSRRVETERYRRAVVRYIDRNPVSAGICTAPAAYPHGSACLYARERGPSWLDRAWVEANVRRSAGLAAYDPAAYGAAFPQAGLGGLESLVKARLDYRGDEPDPLDDLIGAAPATVREWMLRKTRLADRTEPGIPVVDVASVMSVVEEEQQNEGDWSVRWLRNRRCGWAVCRIVLLRDLCGVKYSAIANLCVGGHTRIRNTYVQHAAALKRDEEYGQRLADLAMQAVARCHPAA